MSLTKKGKALPKKTARELEQDVARLVMRSLCQDFKKLKDAAGAFPKELDINYEVVKKWYYGQNAPISSYLLVLLSISPSLLEAVLLQMDFMVLKGVFLSVQKQRTRPRYYQVGNANSYENNPQSGPRNGPINYESSESLLRQRWFVDQIRTNQSPTVSDLMKHWGISHRQAKKDIVALKEQGLIVFEGARKNGKYALL